MKKFIGMIVAAFLVFSVLPSAPVYAANCEENVLDKAWDWATTLGKKDMEKNQILAQNKAERVKKCAEKAGAEMKKKMGF